LGAAIEYVNGLGMDNIAAQEHELLAYATEAVSAIPGIRLMREKRLAYSRSCWTASTRTILNHSTHEIRDGGGRRAIDPASSITEPRNAGNTSGFL
jgi:selenocysteine lyase/cysteine desulfurase